MMTLEEAINHAREVAEKKAQSQILWDFRFLS